MFDVVADKTPAGGAWRVGLREERTRSEVGEGQSGVSTDLLSLYALGYAAIVCSYLSVIMHAWRGRTIRY